MNTRDDLETRLRDALADRAARTTVHERDWDERAAIGGVVDLDARRRPRRVAMSAVAVAALVALVVGVVAVVRGGDGDGTLGVTTGRVDGGTLPVFVPQFVPDGFVPMTAAKMRAQMRQTNDTCLRWRVERGVVRCTSVIGVTARAYERKGSSDPLAIVTATGSSIDDFVAGADGRRPVEVRGHRGTYVPGSDGTGPTLLWHERDGVSILVGAPAGVSEATLLRVAESVREARDRVSSPAFLVGDVRMPDRIETGYGDVVHVGVRPGGDCIGTAIYVPCAPIRHTGELDVFGGRGMEFPALIARVGPRVDRVELQATDGSRRTLRIREPGAPFEGERFVVEPVAEDVIPDALVAYGSDGRVVARTSFAPKERRSYTPLTSGTTHGIAYRVWYKRTAHDFCLAIDSALGQAGGECTGDSDTSTSTTSYFVWGTTRDDRLAHVELDGVMGRVFHEPEWDFQVFFAVRPNAASSHLVGYDTAGNVVLRDDVGCSADSSSCASSGGSGSGSASSSSGSGESSAVVATTAPAAP